jgi:hypothetical protein
MASTFAIAERTCALRSAPLCFRAIAFVAASISFRRPAHVNDWWCGLDLRDLSLRSGRH